MPGSRRFVLTICRGLQGPPALACTYPSLQHECCRSAARKELVCARVRVRRSLSGLSFSLSLSPSPSLSLCISLPLSLCYLSAISLLSFCYLSAISLLSLCYTSAFPSLSVGSLSLPPPLSPSPFSPRLVGWHQASIYSALRTYTWHSPKILRFA